MTKHHPPNERHYALLGLQPGATAAQVKKAYRAKIKKCHPDADRATDPLEANARAASVNAAYQVLLTDLHSRPCQHGLESEIASRFAEFLRNHPPSNLRAFERAFQEVDLAFGTQKRRRQRLSSELHPTFVLQIISDRVHVWVQVGNRVKTFREVIRTLPPDHPDVNLIALLQLCAQDKSSRIDVTDNPFDLLRRLAITSRLFLYGNTSTALVWADPWRVVLNFRRTHGDFLVFDPLIVRQHERLHMGDALLVSERGYVIRSTEIAGLQYAHWARLARLRESRVATTELDRALTRLAELPELPQLDVDQSELRSELARPILKFELERHGQVYIGRAFFDYERGVVSCADTRSGWFDTEKRIMFRRAFAEEHRLLSLVLGMGLRELPNGSFVVARRQVEEVSKALKHIGCCVVLKPE